MIDQKTKGKIINALRMISWFYPPGTERKRRQKRDKALFECESCHKYCYEGKSKKTFALYVKKYPDKLVEMDQCQKDHLLPFIPIKQGWTWSWDEIINNLFCDIEGYRILCKSQCHRIKTERENEERKRLRNLTKTQ